MSNQRDDWKLTTDERTPDDGDVGEDPKHPHPQDRAVSSSDEMDDDRQADRDESPADAG